MMYKISDKTDIHIIICPCIEPASSDKSKQDMIKGQRQQNTIERLLTCTRVVGTLLTDTRRTPIEAVTADKCKEAIVLLQELLDGEATRGRSVAVLQDKVSDGELAGLLHAPEALLCLIVSKAAGVLSVATHVPVVVQDTVAQDVLPGEVTVVGAFSHTDPAGIGDIPLLHCQNVLFADMGAWHIAVLPREVFKYKALWAHNLIVIVL